ncbi:MAG: hypothetical protein IKB70_02680 [Bacilli bacterium]|nr:hypothetical protein [Bacilli bacterium]
MGLISFVATSLVASALAYLGEKQNAEAEARNYYSKVIIDACNNYIDTAQKAIDERRAKMSEFLEIIGKLKKDAVELVFADYLDTLSNKFINFNVDEEVDGSFDYSKELMTVDKMKEMIYAISKAEMIVSNGNYKENSFAVSLAILGVTTVASSAVSGVMSSILLGNSFTLLHAIPISLGTGFAITGLLNNYKSKQNYQDALEFYEKTKKFSEEAVSLCNAYDKLLDYVAYIGNNLRTLTLNFADYVAELMGIVEDKSNEGFELVDARNLSISERRLLKNSYIFAQIVYASYDLPLFSKEGDINIDTSSAVISNMNDASEIMWSR